MKERLPVPASTIEAQRAAADPAVSAWVSANAGSGKTHVLASRVIRLLLAGTDPQKILCLTYTKAAAANMANRVFDTLGKWTMMEDEKLAAAIAEIEGKSPGSALLKRARQLFARALETPGGLKIQTIHAFCEAVLHQFPLEANIAGHFELLDSQMETALVAEARRDLLTGASHGDGGALAEAFAKVLEICGESGMDGLLSAIVMNRDGLREFLDFKGGAKGCLEALRDEHGFGANEDAVSIAMDGWPLPGLDPVFLAEVRDFAANAGAKKAYEASYGAVVASREADPVRRLDQAAEALLKSNGEAYSPGWLFTKAMHARFDDLGERYLEGCAALSATLDRLALLRMLEATHAALTIADWMIARYEQLKRARGFLDFNDLIMRTSHLLKRPDAGPWVQYKLDQGIDHVLVDEAQDTSPVQWDVVTRLTAEFFTGEGARSNILRTVFAVGDEKQSIYSFQGAEPEAFEATRRAIGAKAGEAGRDFKAVRLTHSFRSTRDVLEAVDLVFGTPEARKGLSQNDDVLKHEAIREHHPGLVEVWPSLGADKVEADHDWTVPVDQASAPAVRLADHIARTIDGWLKRGDLIEGRGRPIRPGDVLVLVRKRDRFVHALSRKLKELTIPVAGADRLSLPGHIAVKDLIAIGRFVMQPHDDLSLAAALKSPVFGLDDDHLMDLSFGRAKGQTLWSRLRDMARSDVRFAGAAALLGKWRTEAGFKRAADFYAGLIGRDGVRRLMVERLGPEAGEILDEFLAFALAREKLGAGDLESFLATLEASGPDIKREMDQARNEVRIMTVHASKGLEAPIVFLIDSGSKPFQASHRPPLMSYRPAASSDPVKRWLWRGPGSNANAVSKQLDEHLAGKAGEEYRRLLYVGMTRAEDRLVVCGYHGTRDPGDDIWLRLVTAGLATSLATSQLDDPVTGQSILRFRVSGDTGPAAKPEDEAASASHPAFPFDPARPLAPPDSLPRPLSPSGAALLIEAGVDSHAAPLSPVLDASDAAPLSIRRGIAVHKLFQMLPGLPAERREEAGRHWLARTAGDWPEGEPGRALASVLDALADPVFADAFAPGSRAEVNVTGLVTVRGRPHQVTGIIDRLAVSRTQVLVLDYKTNRPAPRDSSRLPESHVLQMALYAEVLRPLYPGLPVRAALLYTETGRLIEVGEDVMAATLARLGKA